MLTLKNPKPMLISTKINMIRFHKYFAFAIVTFIVNVAFGQNSISLTNSKKVSCFGGSDGIITVSVTGFTPSSYKISSSTFPLTTINPVTNPMDLNGLPVGSYTVEALDGIGNSISSTVTVDQITTLQIVGYKAVDVTCFSGADGSVDIDNITGGTSPYSYSFNSGSYVGTSNFTGKSAGTFTISVKDANGCIANSNAIIGTPAKVTSTVVQTNVFCNGKLTGALDITAAGGSSTYSKYTWTSTPTGYSSTSEDLTGLAAGTYNVEIEDNKGCKGTSTYVITEPTAITATPTAKDLKCNNDNSGEISLSVSGGTPGYTYQWSGPVGFSPTTQNVTGLAADNGYSVKITDANLCELTLNSIVVKEPALLEATAVVKDADCKGAATGEIALTPTGGTTPYTYAWTGPGTFSAITEDLTNVNAGDYEVTVTDNKGCTVISKSTITEPLKLSISEVVTEVDCNGAATGEINVTTSGGTIPYAFQWDDAPINSTTEDLTALKAGDYEITVVDKNGCTEIKKITVSEPLIISITETHVDNVCNGEQLGSIDASVSGGTLAAGNTYSFDWQSGGSQVDVTEDLFNLAAGLYDLTVTDDEKCVMTLSVEIKEPTKIKAAGNVTNVACYQGNTGDIVMSITDGTVAGSSNYKVSWTGPGGYISNDQDITTLYAGDYDYTIEDDNACQITGTITVTEPTELILSYTSASVCDGDGVLTFSAKGGTTATGEYTYALDNSPLTSPASPVKNLIDGKYVIKAIDDNACEDTVHAIVKHVDAVLPVVKTKMKVVYLDGSGLATISTTDIDNISTDNCGIKSMVLDKTSFDCTEVGQKIVKLTITDINDNVNSDTASVFVRDTISPTISVIDLVIAIDTSGKAYLTESMVTTASGDNCKVKDTTLSAYQFDLTQLGNNSVDVIITDVNGNSKTKKINVNVYIADTDKDSIPDYVERNFDTDKDGTPNYLDLDSDNDAISDLVENDSQKLYTSQDFDGDGIPNALDLDSDDDGINDVIEGDIADNDANGDGQKDNNILVGLPNDKDSDGSPDYLDLDSDNDGINDIVESLLKFTDADLNGKVDGLDTDKDGIKDEADGATGWADNSDKRPANSDTDVTEDWRDLDSDDDGISDKIEGVINSDTDALPNYLDSDSDDDGISDKIETDNDFDGDTKGNYIDTDSDNDLIDDKIEGTSDQDTDTKGNWLDDDSDGDGIDDKTETAADADGDTKGNWLDLDSDEDGIEDKTEGTADPDGDTKGNWLDDDSDGDGILDKTETAADLDGDNIGNWLDLDSDDDEMTDQIEGILDVNNNGKLDFVDAQYVIPEGFSPNGDGINDNFYITGLRVYKESELIVINQWGQVVYESGLGYTNNWDGIYGGNGLKFGTGTVPEGIYYFVYKPNKFDLPNITGNIYIKP